VNKINCEDRIAVIFEYPNTRQNLKSLYNHNRRIGVRGMSDSRTERVSKLAALGYQ